MMSTILLCNYGVNVDCSYFSLHTPSILPALVMFTLVLICEILTTCKLFEALQHDVYYGFPSFVKNCKILLCTWSNIEKMICWFLPVWYTLTANYVHFCESDIATEIVLFCGPLLLWLYIVSNQRLLFFC